VAARADIAYDPRDYCAHCGQDLQTDPGGAHAAFHSSCWKCWHEHNRPDTPEPDSELERSVPRHVRYRGHTSAYLEGYLAGYRQGLHDAAVG
jgi:hypothetical protein